MGDRQPISESKSPRSQQAKERQPQGTRASEETLVSQQEPLAQVISPMRKVPSPRTHAAIVNRLTASSPSLTQRTLLQLQRQYGNRYVQRVLAISRQGEGSAEVAPEVEVAIQRKRGGGQALDGKVQAQMESAFGTDFAGVRVHADGEADALNQGLRARAFTTGQDIFFRQGEYEPGSSRGQELLAHELTHVVQQSGGLQRKLIIGQPGDQYEQEADRVARAVMQLEQAPLQQKACERLACQLTQEEEEEMLQTKAEHGQVEGQKSVFGAGQYHKAGTLSQIAYQILQRTSTTVDGITWYSTRAEAEAAVDPHVSPRNCFVWQGGGPEGHPWRVIPGTGCAHWVAHQMNITGTPGCFVGNSIRVAQVIAGRTRYPLAQAQVGDIWTNEGGTHTGIVRALNRDATGNVISAQVEHCSSGQGGVVTNNFAAGHFYR